MIQYIKGDARITDDQVKTYILHICNDEHIWSMGFAKALDDYYPLAKKIYMSEEIELAMIQNVSIHENLNIVNMIAQKGVISQYNPKPIDYDALDQCLEQSFVWAAKEKARIQMPKIGSGLAGGDWDVISDMIENKLKDYPLELFVYLFD